MKKKGPLPSSGKRGVKPKSPKVDPGVPAGKGKKGATKRKKKKEGWSREGPGKEPAYSHNREQRM